MASSSSASSTVTASNSRVTISLPAPRAPAKSYLPGDTLRPSVAFQGSPDYISQSLTFKGTFKFGLEWWQTGDANGPLAAAKAPAPKLVTFLELPIHLVSSSQAREQVKEKGPGVRSSIRDGEGLYEFELPSSFGEPGDVLPPFAMGAMDHLERFPAAVYVLYTIEFQGIRKGRFKFNDLLTLNVPLSIPTQERTDTLEADWPSARASNDLKGESQKSTKILRASLRHHPLSTSEEPLLFRLSLTASDSSLRLRSSEFLLSISILRKISTLDPSPKVVEREKELVSIYLREKPVFSVVSGGEGEIKWEGIVVVPKINRTVESALLKIKYSLSLLISSPLLSNSFVVATEVFLPSSEISVAYLGSESVPPPYLLPPYEG